MEDDEDVDDAAEIQADGYGNDERLLTPTQEAALRSHPPGSHSPEHVSPQIIRDDGDRQVKDDKNRKHRSTSSSFIPKISRWSKTTATSAPETPYVDDLRDRPHSHSSQADSNVDQQEQHYRLYKADEDQRTPSRASLPHSEEASAVYSIYRSPSPLIPSETGSLTPRHSPLPPAGSPEDLTSAKYGANRNSLEVQHPQPRHANTPRHQTNLESQVTDFNAAGSDLSQNTAPDYDLGAVLPGWPGCHMVRR